MDRLDEAEDRLDEAPQAPDVDVRESAARALHVVIRPPTSGTEHVEVTIRGPLTSATVEFVGDTVLPLLRAGRRVVLDLSGVTSMDALAPGLLGELVADARGIGTHLHLAATAGSRLALSIGESLSLRRVLGVGTASD